MPTPRNIPNDNPAKDKDPAKDPFTPDKDPTTTDKDLATDKWGNFPTVEDKDDKRDDFRTVEDKDDSRTVEDEDTSMIVHRQNVQQPDGSFKMIEHGPMPTSEWPAYEKKHGL